MRILGTYDKILKYVGIPLQFLGMASIAEGFFEWRGFFGKILSHYEAARSFLFSWIPLSIPSYLQDYLVIGFGLAVSVFLIMVPAKQLAKPHTDAPRSFAIAVFDLLFFLLLFLFWPAAVLMMFFNTYLYFWSVRKLKSKIDPASLPTKAERREWNKIPHLRGKTRKQIIAFGENYLIITILMLVSVFLFSDFTTQ